MIDVINLQKSFGDKEILKGINVTINKGDIVAVLGPSGSGKSTFLRCLNCMEDPTGGSIIFNGVDIADMKVDINQHRRHMGMVFQHFNLYNNKTVLQNVMMAPAYLKCKDIDKAKKKNRMIKFKNMFRGSDKKEELIPITETKEQIKKEVKEQAMALLKRIGLEDKADVYPSTLSGGQKQRVAIAGVVTMEPKCIVFDEPTAMLDPNGRKEVIATAHDLNKKKGVTIILITHYMEEVVDADYVYVMEKGKIVMDGTPRDIFSRVDELKEHRLDVPQATLVADELRSAGVPIPQGILTRKELVDAIMSVANA